MKYLYFRILLLLLMLASSIGWADVVKPALVEINVFADGSYRVELRASLEAMLTGINAQFKDTTESPNAEAYDELRGLQPDALAEAFAPFQSEVLKEVQLKFDGQLVTPKISHIDIPERGYTKIPRISTISLTGHYPESAQSLTWYYPARFGDNVVRVRQENKTDQQFHWSPHQWIRDDSVSQPFSITEVASPRGFWQVVGDYLLAGIQHIIPKGLDHILFILGLYLFSTHIRPLLWQVTMFTLAHTITLGLAMYGLVQLPAAIVEPLIALSIAYVGVENIWHRKLARSRLALVFGFGLLHGMGFASVLSDFGMPKDAFATALIAFNIGVEMGQLTVILSAWLLTGLWFRHKAWYREMIVIPASLAISAIALYWFWDRLTWPIPGL